MSPAATQLKPDVGTPELPAGRVRVRVEADGTVTEVDEEHVHRVSPQARNPTEAPCAAHAGRSVRRGWGGSFYPARAAAAPPLCQTGIS